MTIHRKMLRVLLLSFIVSLGSGCGNAVNERNENFDRMEYIEFPRDEQGYPRRNVVIINKSEYTLNNIEKSHTASHIDQEIQLQGIEEGDNIEVILPQYLPAYFWSIEEKETIDLINYSKSEVSIEQALEGKSAYIQKFTFYIANDKNVLLKWSNISECGKSFTEKNEEYLLKISFI